MNGRACRNGLEENLVLNKQQWKAKAHEEAEWVNRNKTGIGRRTRTIPETNTVKLIIKLQSFYFRTLVENSPPDKYFKKNVMD